jgi:hypothetical protein
MNLRVSFSTTSFHQFCWDLINTCDFCLYGFSASKVHGSGTSSSSVCISVSLTSLTLRIFNSLHGVPIDLVIVIKKIQHDASF